MRNRNYNIPYSIGIDPGKSRTGIAAVYEKDGKHNIFLHDGKPQLEVLIYPEADTNKDRRSFRGNRRNLKKEKERRTFLRTIFGPAITETDPLFFERLDDSFFCREDKSTGSIHVLYDEPCYSDKDYYDKYPTAYHLIDSMLNGGDEVNDPKLMFLALHFLMKHRGNFNTKLAGANRESSLEELVDEFSSLLKDILGIDFTIDHKLLLDVFKSNLKLKEKTAEICSKTGYSPNSEQGTVLSMLLNRKIDTKKFMPALESDDKSATKIQLSDLADEDKYAEAEILYDQYFPVIDAAFEIYTKCLVMRLIGDHDQPGLYISQAKVEEYNTNKTDLALLKKLVKSLDADMYKKLFKENGADSYSNHMSSPSDKDKKTDAGSGKCGFYDALKKFLEKQEPTDEITYFLNKIDNNTLLRKLQRSENSVFPNKLRAKEVRKILELSKLPLLDNIGISGTLTNREEIIQIFEFHVPYFIGPLSETSELNDGNGWIVRRNSDKVYPWNWTQVIDVHKTRERFIQKMVRNCTYIQSAKVLPKSSLLYQQFMVLNELNTIVINGARITDEVKLLIYKNIFLQKKATPKNVTDFLLSRHIINNANDVMFNDKKITNNLNSRLSIKKIIGDKIDACADRVEDFIYMSTVYGNEKALFKDCMLAEFTDVFTEAEIEKLYPLNFKDWGNLSKEFLLTEDGKGQGTIIDIMTEHALNLQELLYDKNYTFRQDIKARAFSEHINISDISYDDVKALGYSNPCNRAIWITIKAIRNMVQRIGSEPKAIYIETTRNNGTKERTKPIAEQYKELYKGHPDRKYWYEIIDDLASNGLINAQRMRLFLSQQGIDIYTGKRIDYDVLKKDIQSNIYNIDHLIPRRLKVDNSYDNKVLTSVDFNKTIKDGNYPLCTCIDKAVINSTLKPLWQKLHEQKFMSDIMYQALIREVPLSDNERADFINRDLTETSQVTKGLLTLMQRCFPYSKVKGVRSELVSEFRQQFGLAKSRLINEHHHAHDAYLANIIGSAYNALFDDDCKKFIQEHADFNASKIFDYRIEKNGKVIWEPCKKDANGQYIIKKGTTMATIAKNIKKWQPKYSYKAFEGKGKLFDTNIKSKGQAKPDCYHAIKTSDDRLSHLEKYGGFKSIKGAYFLIVESDGETGERITTIEPIYIVDKTAIEANKTTALDICKSRGLKNPAIITDKMLPGTLCKIDGIPFRITGRTGEKLCVTNAIPFNVPLKMMKYISVIEKDQHRLADENNNIILYDYIMEQFTNGDFKKIKIFNSRLPKTITEGREKFVALDKKAQCKVLAGLLSLTSTAQSGGADLTAIGGTAHSGVLGLNKNITGKDFVICA